MMEKKRTIKVYPAECRWLDIGRPDDYGVATASFEKYRGEFLRPEVPHVSEPEDALKNDPTSRSKTQAR
jgi:NDP-sugar pyrophosphorylase family protein